MGLYVRWKIGWLRCPLCGEPASGPYDVNEGIKSSFYINDQAVH
jgi:hypothetical protein